MAGLKIKKGGVTSWIHTDISKKKGFCSSFLFFFNLNNKSYLKKKEIYY